ncbi:MAG: DNA repair protein RecO [Candidatus Nealsonbacteria bacterium]
MAVHYRTKGIFIKKTDRGETDQLFTIYTEDFGKLDILGRAIRKIRSKLRSGAELFYLSEIEFIQGKTYKTLTDALLIDSFQNTRKKLKRLAVVHKIGEVLNGLIKGQEADEKIWQLVYSTFLKLDKEEKNWEFIYYYFFWKILSFLGYEPELHHCVVCQKKIIPGILYFSSGEGGLVCDKCFEEKKEAEEVSQNLIKILRILYSKDWKFVSKLKIGPELEKSLKNISENYLNYILGKTQ